MTEPKTGRKRLSDLEKKVPVTAWITGREVKALGGIAQARKTSLDYLTETAAKKPTPSSTKTKAK